MNAAPVELWQDRDIKFDSPAQYLALRRGEFVIEKLPEVEDTKVRPGARASTRASADVLW